jgi:hypothetical protein
LAVLTTSQGMIATRTCFGSISNSSMLATSLPWLALDERQEVALRLMALSGRRRS